MSTFKQLLAALGSNHLLKDKILCIQTKKPLLFLQEAALEVKAINGRLEPAKMPQNKGEIDKIYSSSLLMSGIMSRVRASFEKCPNPSLCEIVSIWS
jgi:hypothetical protein